MTPTDWWDLPGAPPLHATRRDPDYPTEGGRVALIGQALGTPFMPWQRYTADVAGELNPDGSYHYPVVVVSVPRQSGKTTLMRAVGVDRAVSRDGLGVFYTAQTGKDARERWQDLVRAIKASPLQGMVRVRSASGSERVVFANGSMFRCFAPVATSLHGYTPPLVMLDEAFAHDEQTGDDLMGAIGPAQVTIPHRQLWIVSTAGTAASTFLRRWVEAGRAQAPGVALLEWAAPAEVDIYDPAGWPTFHPAMHTGLVSPAAIQAEAERLPRPEFERAYGNRWTRTASHLISADQWDRLGERPPGHHPDSGVVFGYDVMHDRSAAAITATWYDQAGRLQAKVARSGPGMAWLYDALRELHGQGWRDFTCPADGPAREVADVLRREHIATELVSGQDYADSWGFLMQHIAHATLDHDGTDALAVSAANIATRPRGDGAAPSHRHSAGDITALVALMAAAWWLDHKPYAGGLDYGFSA